MQFGRVFDLYNIRKLFLNITSGKLIDIGAGIPPSAGRS
jgi:hypothetical protein